MRNLEPEWGTEIIIATTIIKNNASKESVAWNI